MNSSYFTSIDKYQEQQLEICVARMNFRFPLENFPWKKFSVHTHTLSLENLINNLLLLQPFKFVLHLGCFRMSFQVFIHFFFSYIPRFHAHTKINSHTNTHLNHRHLHRTRQKIFLVCVRSAKFSNCAPFAYFFFRWLLFFSNFSAVGIIL